MKFPTESKIKVVVLLAVSGLICLGVGAVVLVLPDTAATRIGYSFAKAGGKSEFMTFYGGFYTGIGLFLLLATQIRYLRPGAVSFLTLSATAAIPVRIYSLVQFRVSDPVFFELLIGEFLFATAGGLGWYWLNECDCGSDGGGDGG